MGGRGGAWGGAAGRARGTGGGVARSGLAAPGAVAEAFRREGLEMATVFEHTREFLRSGMEAIAPGLFDWQLAARARGEAEFAIDGEDAAAPCAAMGADGLVAAPPSVEEVAAKAEGGGAKKRAADGSTKEAEDSAAAQRFEPL